MLLSIVIATYNRCVHLRETLASILPQLAGVPVELIIVDDCSTDDTWQWLLETFDAESSRIVCLRTDRNVGPGPARNLGLSVARGRYFVPIDSDFLLLDGSLQKIIALLGTQAGRYQLLFFRCMLYPAMRRMDPYAGPATVTRNDILQGSCGELLPVADLEFIRRHKLSYPDLRAGGEGILWAKLLEHGPAHFTDVSIVLYRTDVPERLCTKEYQLAHPDELAKVADAFLDLFSNTENQFSRRSFRRRLIASGIYHSLAGDVQSARLRFISALRLGYPVALIPFAASLLGTRVFRHLFSTYRTCQQLRIVQGALEVVGFIKRLQSS